MRAPAALRPPRSTWPRARAAPRGAALAVALALLPQLVAAQVPEPAGDSVPSETRAKGGSEFWIPFGSVLVPGLGQYLHGAPLAGFAHTAVYLTGIGFGAGGDALGDLPRSAEGQFRSEALHTAATAGFLSAWDAFHRGLPALREEGKYGFLGPEEGLGDLLTAPFDYRFLGRWTTWVDLALTGAVTGWILTHEGGASANRPFQGHDVAFAASLSLNAAVGEEALFRGWLLPMLADRTGSFWGANVIQATLFGVLHPQAEEFALVIGAGAAYNGWVTRRNDWSVRESIFQHFWYDVAVVTATLLRDDRGVVTLLPVQIRF